MKSSLFPTEVLTVAQMYQADQAAIVAGIPGHHLMEAAGFAVAQTVRHYWHKQTVAVLCGPGNNGGDGFVTARWLVKHGWLVRLSLLGQPELLHGDAAWAAALWRGSVAPLSLDSLTGCTLVVDALFGIGLTRSITGVAGAVIEEINRRQLPVVAVDIPSGLHGDTGEILGGLALQAQTTVTFFRLKPGHLLLPGRSLCGRLIVASIGIPESVLDGIHPQIFVNNPDLWHLPRPVSSDHKYNRGHVIAVGGSILTGAIRLAARAARRSGVGVLTIAVPESAIALYALDAPGVIVLPCNEVNTLAILLADETHHPNAVLIGPGIGRSANTRSAVTSVLASGLPCVLDADALTSFADDPMELFTRIHSSCILTPHDGEYASLFGYSHTNRLERARFGAKTAGAVMLLKGADTVVATPDGRATINTNAPATLATAGTGDVLSGLTIGLLAQGMDAFSAACAAVWLHSTTATYVGPGLIAEDLPEALPAILATQYQ